MKINILNSQKKFCLIKVFLFSFTFCMGALAYAADTPVGKWRTIDDETGKPKSIVNIVEEAGELRATVVELLTEENGGKDKVCEKCKGDKHNQPIVGLEIMWGLTQDGDEWSGGKILDPKKGKVYKCVVTVGDGGQTLEVRGFIGFSFIGRSQTWQRLQ